jgi:cobalt-zinc-cadmium efflux system outer membrane protein
MDAAADAAGDGLSHGAEHGSAHGMALGDLEQIALKSNPTLALAAAEIEKERGLWVQTGLYPNPTVGYVQSNATEEGESQTSGLLVQQTFITACKLEKNRAIESFGIEDANWQMEVQQLRVLTDVRLRYFAVLGAQQQLDLVRELRDLAQETLETTRDLFKAQEVARTDVIQAESQLA